MSKRSSSSGDESNKKIKPNNESETHIDLQQNRTEHICENHVIETCKSVGVGDENAKNELIDIEKRMTAEVQKYRQLERLRDKKLIECLKLCIMFKNEKDKIETKIQTDNETKYQQDKKCLADELESQKKKYQEQLEITLQYMKQYEEYKNFYMQQYNANEILATDNVCLKEECENLKQLVKDTSDKKTDK